MPFQVNQATSSESNNSENVRRPKSSETYVAVSLPNLTSSTNLLYSVQVLLIGIVVVKMGEIEYMSHCLYFSSIYCN
jgi:hypothetical protein